MSLSKIIVFLLFVKTEAHNVGKYVVFTYISEQNWDEEFTLTSNFWYCHPNVSSLTQKCEYLKYLAIFICKGTVKFNLKVVNKQLKYENMPLPTYVELEIIIVLPKQISNFDFG